MSNSKDDATTFVVDPSMRPPAEPEVRDPADHTVIMKPSQRAREAAAALDEQRRREASAHLDTVDFDVTSDTAAPAPPPAPARGPRRAWVIGFVIGAMIAAAALGALIALL